MLVLQGPCIRETEAAAALQQESSVMGKCKSQWKSFFSTNSYDVLVNDQSMWNGNYNLDPPTSYPLDIRTKITCKYKPELVSTIILLCLHYFAITAET